MTHRSWPFHGLQGSQNRVRLPYGAWLLAGLAACFAWSRPLGAQRSVQVPGVLFGGGLVEPVARKVEVDPRLPRGALIETEVRPAPTSSYCSLRRPVCVHVLGRESSAATRNAQRALDDLESAYERLFLALEWPKPEPDRVGGTAALDVYLLTETRAHEQLRIAYDGTSSASDTASGFCTLGSAVAEASELTTCLAELSLVGLDAAEGAGLRRGLATYVSQLLEPLSGSAWTAIDDAQANPQINVLARDLDGLSAAGTLFWNYLDASWGQRTSGTLPAAFFAMSRSHTQDGGGQWDNEPDALDVVRSALNDDASAVADLLAGYAVSRLFLGARDDGAHLPGLSWLGDSGRVRADWVLEYSSLPRNVKCSRALEPYGLSYIWLDLDRVSLGAELSFRLEWEAPVSFKWQVVSLDRDGREMNRWDLPYLERQTQLEKTLLNFEGAAALVFVGVNLGAVDPAHPFDPDQQPWEPHAYTLYLAETK